MANTFSGTIGDGLSDCVRGECQVDEECHVSEACENFTCVDPCQRATCGQGSHKKDQSGFNRPV